MGLKAYDLVWLEGKSAAWRYPCEIGELAAFAPPVEEQPFDRFYKKPVATATHTMPVAEPAPAAVINTTPVSAEPVVAPAVAPAPATPIYTGEPSTVPGKRIIYVTMPASRTPASPAPLREISREPELPKVIAPPAPVPEPAHLPYASGPGYASPAVEDISAHLPSLEEQLEAVSPRSSRRRTGRRRNLLKPIAIGIAILALLAAGIFIGLSLNKENLGRPQQKIAAKSQADNNEPTALHPTPQQLPASAANTAIPAATPEKPKDSVQAIIGQSTTTVPPVTRPPHPTTPKDKPANPKKGALPPAATRDSAAGMNTSALHREAVHRADIVETRSETNLDKEAAARSALASQVSVGANGYSVGTFGGINDLQLTVTNRSTYPLDLVIVEVQYVQANKKIYKTENLYFRSIGAGAALMQEAPKSSRGIKVQYKIVTISSKELGLSYSGI